MMQDCHLRCKLEDVHDVLGRSLDGYKRKERRKCKKNKHAVRD